MEGSHFVRLKFSSCSSLDVIFAYESQFVRHGGGDAYQLFLIKFLTYTFLCLNGLQPILVFQSAFLHNLLSFTLQLHPQSFIDFLSFTILYVIG